jgi:starch phosphorylase
MLRGRLNFGNPWEIERPNVSYPVKFYGHVSVNTDAAGRQSFRWHAGEEVLAVAYDTPVPGWKTPNTNNLRLWSAKPAREFDLESFNTGDYVAAILAKQRAETISSVLYPDDRTYQGKELRLKQQFFMVSATLQDILRRYSDAHKGDDEALKRLHEKVALQLNDTHPTIGVPELMRLLMDEHGLGWTAAWDITTHVFSFTNHTVLPEALEKWPVELVEALLPRHMQIIYDINWRFVQELQKSFPDDLERVGRMSIIEEGDTKCVRMAHLALVASHTVNGVAYIHSELIKTTIFRDFYTLWPHKFQNKTNGVTPRRWLAFCNPPLRALISSALKTDAWIGEADLLTGLRPFADDAVFRTDWAAVKRAAKVRLAGVIKEQCGVAVSPDALFDIQVKRIHEYKRQLLNVLSIIDRYDTIMRMTPAQRAHAVPRVCIIGGKAAPGYDMAKRIIKLVSAVGDKINSDPDVGDLLKLVFIPDYNVSLAEVIVPASELSQHISTAGTEASGTSNMKFAMNGCLIIGTMDGANVEIAEEIGAENMFVFGALAADVPRLRRERASFKPCDRFFAVCDMIRHGAFGWADFFAPIVDSITQGDYYLLGVDFEAYLKAQDAVDATYRDAERWTRMSILSTAGTGKFSSDRTIREYAADIWRVSPARRPSAGVPGSFKAAADS